MIYVQISSGRGPAECGLAISHIRSKMLAEWPLAKLIRGGGYQTSIIGFDDPSADLYVRCWEGTILWVCSDPLHLGGRKRKNWYVGVRRIVMPDYVKVELRDADLVSETMRASGKGGQRVNKVSSKVRLTHLPTGIVVVSESERSQQRNIAIARQQLMVKLKEREDNIFAALETANWTQHNQLERGNPVRVFDGPGFVERG